MEAAVLRSPNDLATQIVQGDCVFKAVCDDAGRESQAYKPSYGQREFSQR